AQAKRDALDQKYKDALAVPTEKRTPEQKKLVSDAQPLLKVSWDDVLEAMGPEDRAKRLAPRGQIHAIQGRSPPPAPGAWAIKDGDEKPETFVLKRGNPKAKWTAVGPAFPRVLAAAPAEPKTRLELAKWLTRPEHPLTARVMVNRLWHHHFGRGIVASPNDFGVRGERPTHPELLDWLACELVKPTWSASVAHAPGSPWSLKHIHPPIRLPTTHRQSTAAPAGTLKADPENKLFGRMNRRRLEAEAIRDSVLTAAGTLNPETGGPSVKVPLEPEVYDLIFTEGEPDGLWPVT